MVAVVRPIQITIEQKIQTFMATKIKNLEYDAPLEVRCWRHLAELAIVHEVENVQLKCIQTAVKLETAIGQQGLYL